jgi:hypothetical protein
MTKLVTPTELAAPLIIQFGINFCHGHLQLHTPIGGDIIIADKNGIKAILIFTFTGQRICKKV